MQGVPAWAPTLFMYVAFAAIFYFILWKPQADQRKRQQSLIDAVKRGDEIVTAGGIVGQIVHIQEQTAGKMSPNDRVTIKSGESRLVVERGRITGVTSTVSTTTTSAAANG